MSKLNWDEAQRDRENEEQSSPAERQPAVTRRDRRQGFKALEELTRILQARAGRRRKRR